MNREKKKKRNECNHHNRGSFRSGHCQYSNGEEEENAAPCGPTPEAPKTSQSDKVRIKLSHEILIPPSGMYTLTMACKNQRASLKKNDKRLMRG